MLFIMLPLRRCFAKRQLGIFFLAIIPVALFFIMRAKLSWRPRVLGQMRNGITAIAWSPDGKWLASASGDTSTWNAPAEIYVRPVQSRGGNKWFKIPETLKTLHFSADGRELIGVDISQKLHRWDWQKRVALPSTLPIGVLAVSDDAKLAAIATRGGVTIHSVQSGQLIGFLKDLRGVLKVAAFSQDGKKLALFCAQSLHAEGNSLQIWKISSGNQPVEWTSDDFLLRKTPFSMRFWLDKKSVVLLGPIGIWVFRSNGGHFGFAENVLMNSPKDQFPTIPFAFNQNHVTWYDPITDSIPLQPWPSRRIERQLHRRVAPSAIQTLAFSPDGATLAGGDDKGFITLWRIK